MAAVGDGGDYLVTWSADGESVGQMIGADGNLIGGVFDVRAQGFGSPGASEVTLPNGNTVSVRVGGANDQILLDVTTSHGTVLQDDFRVDVTGGNADNVRPLIFVLGNGHFIVAWDFIMNFYDEVMIREFDANGNALGEQFHAYSKAPFLSIPPQVLVLGEDRYAIVSDLYGVTTHIYSSNINGVLGPLSERAFGDDDDDVFRSEPNGTAGDLLWGSGGVDTLELTAPGLLYLHSASAIELVRGTSGDDTLARLIHEGDGVSGRGRGDARG